MARDARKCFRPLFWGFVFNWFDDVEDFLKALARVFVPSSGDLFLIEWGAALNHDWLQKSFRPLFWGFVFNSGGIWMNQIERQARVFVPSSGDLFLIRAVPLRHRLFLRGGFSSPLLGICF